MSYTPSVNPNNTPQWIKITKLYSDFATAGLTNDIEIYSLSAKQVVHSAVIHHTAAFVGGTIASYTMSVGSGTPFVNYIAASNVFQAAGNTVIFPAISAPIAQLPQNFGASTSIRAAAISTVGLLNAATAGSVDFYLLVSNLP